MTLTQRTVGATLDLSNLTDPAFAGLVIEVAGQEINFGLTGVQKDTTAWLNWMLNGGAKLRANKRSLAVNAYGITQSTLCLALEPYYGSIDWDNPQHYALIERATRPLNEALRG